MIAACITVTGVVSTVRSEPDGDIHVNVTLDPRDAGLINQYNVSAEHRALVTEIVPADEPGCTPGQAPRPASATYDYGICTGADETPPPIGEHVAVTGPYVLDTDHGWMEIHPVWSITAAGSPAAPPTDAPPATTVPAQPAAGTTITSGPGTVTPGQTASLTAQTSPGAACTLSVTLPSGAQSASSGLGSRTADGAGVVRWSWKIGTRTSPGTATATVTCTTGTATESFAIT